jgi:UDP-N-acetylglucosamine/UDP-N-acetylgalactosamine diphosphorylase
MSQTLVSGLQANIDVCIQERIKRLSAFAEKLEQSKDILLQRGKGQGSPSVDVHDTVLGKLTRLSSILDQAENDIKAPGPDGETFIQHIDTKNNDSKKDYVGFIQNLDESISTLGSAWLKGIEDRIVGAFALNG